MLALQFLISTYNMDETLTHKDNKGEADEFWKR